MLQEYSNARLVVQTPARQPDQPGAPTGGMSNAQAPPPQQQIPSNLASGAGAFNPFAGLTGARYAGQVPLPSANMFGPDRSLLLLPLLTA